MTKSHEQSDGVTIKLSRDVYDLLGKMAEAHWRNRQQEAHVIILEKAHELGLIKKEQIKAEVRTKT